MIHRLLTQVMNPRIVATAITVRGNRFQFARFVSIGATSKRNRRLLNKVEEMELETAKENELAGANANATASLPQLDLLHQIAKHRIVHGKERIKVGEFTDNESYQRHILDMAIEKQFDYLRFEDPKLADVSRQMYRKIQPITPNDSYVSCTTFDSKGNVVAVSRRYPKLKFLKENNLFPRDLRKIDASSIDVVPLIMVRGDNSLLINMLHIKAIIKKDRVMIFDSLNTQIATKLGLFMYDLEMKLKTPATSIGGEALSYEFKALECMLINVMSFLDSELKTHLFSCGTILEELEDQIDRNQLRELLIRLKLLASFYQKAVLIRDVLDEILENDEDLAAMYLSENKQYDKTVENPTDYQDLEMLLESYYNHCDEFVQHSGSLLNDIKATEEIANIILDANRNSLMLFELKVTVYTLGFTVATLVPAFYGMNLKNYIEESEVGFGAVVVLLIIQGIIVTSYMFRKLKSVQKLTMMSGASMGPTNLKRNQTQRLLQARWLLMGPPPTQAHRRGNPDVANARAEALAANSRRRLSPWSSRVQKRAWYKKWIFGDRNTQFDGPTKTEKDVLWRMINDDKLIK